MIWPFKKPAVSAPSLPQPLEASADELHSQGLRLAQAGQWQPAMVLLHKANALAPHQPHLLNNMGSVCKMMGGWRQAELCYQQACELEPSMASAWANWGVVRLEQHDFKYALELADRAIEAQIDFAPACYLRGNALFELGLYPEAALAYERVLELNPNDVNAWNNLGRCHTKTLDWSGAQGCFNRALSLHREQSNLPLAIEHYATALRLEPGNHLPELNLSLCLLKQGNYAPGWTSYEARWRSEGRTWPYPESMLWRGQDIRGKRLMVYWEQGLGDTLSFIRFVPLLRQGGAHVMLRVQAPLRLLLQESIEVDEWVDDRDEHVEFDWHCPLMSLPGVLQINLDNLPNAIPYLRAPSARLAHWESRLPQSQRLRAGLVWRGGPGQRGAADRSLGFESVSTWLRARPDVQWICLQKEYKPQDWDLSRDYPGLVHLGDELHDMADTAAAIMQLDLVITVCTSVGHLAAALGKPTWIALIHNADFRWLLNRDDSPWYPGVVRLYRQQQPGDWTGVIEHIQSDLFALQKAQSLVQSNTRGA
jgi:tetratricopeptide (TPR) repeat protein